MITKPTSIKIYDRQSKMIEDIIERYGYFSNKPEVIEYALHTYFNKLIENIGLTIVDIESKMALNDKKKIGQKGIYDLATKKVVSESKESNKILADNIMGVPRKLILVRIPAELIEDIRKLFVDTKLYESVQKFSEYAMMYIEHEFMSVFPTLKQIKEVNEISIEMIEFMTQKSNDD